MEGLQEGVEVASISKVEEATLTKHYFIKFQGMDQVKSWR